MLTYKTTVIYTRHMQLYTHHETKTFVPYRVHPLTRQEKKRKIKTHFFVCLFSCVVGKENK